MTEINYNNLLKNGFILELENKEANNYWLKKDVRNWSINYRIHNGVLYEFIIEADGCYEDSGSFDLRHFKYIEQIDKLISAMLLTKKD